MGLPARNREAPRLRLVVDNAVRRTVLMPILEVERRLASVERSLRRPGVPETERRALGEMRDLLRRELAARPFDPDVARRCEHRLRWIEAARRQRGAPAASPGLLDRALRALGAMLPPPVASV